MFYIFDFIFLVNHFIARMFHTCHKNVHGRYIFEMYVSTRTLTLFTLENQNKQISNGYFVVE